MTPLAIVLAGAGTIAAGGLLALVLARAPRLGALAGAAVVALGCGVGLWGALAGLLEGTAGELAAAWQVPGGALIVGLDPLSAFFLVPIFGLGALAAIYGRGYLGARPLAAGWLGLLLAAMALVVLARHALLFLVAWEAMTLLSYLLITVDDEAADVRRAGWVYLIAGHVALVALLALFLALGTRAGGALDFAALAAAPAPAGFLVLALFGFGIKAGVVGVHVWLPEAHAAAPAHVSALMSGALIKLGLYGLLRVALFVPPPGWLAVTLMVLGVLGALIGIALALSQRDLKRALAYSSVENVGVILLGLGLGFWLRGRGDAALAAVAFAGALLHVWNHAAMKGLMFLGAGSVVHATGTRDVERLGGLLGRMPWTGRAMIVGAVAIAALPPLNGFAGEFLLYRALGEVGGSADAAAGLAAITGAAALALVGGLAALCFVRLTGVALLGAPRSDAAARAHESPPLMTLPMVALAAACVAGALVAPALVAGQSALLAELGAGAAPAGALAPLVTVEAAFLGAVALFALLVFARARRAARAETWGCGYAAPTPRMQYTGRAFAELVTARALPRWLRPRALVHAPEGVFPRAADLATDTTDPLTRSVYEPLLVRSGDRFARLRFLQQGNVHVYIVYIVTTVIVALGWVVAREWWAR
jgi:hydrogenase-4 component B